MRDDGDLFTTLYTELKRRANAQLRRLPPGQTLQPTEIVHEVYARLMRQGTVAWESRSQFLAMAVTAMRDVLIEAIRRRLALKRGGDLVRVTLTDDKGELNMSAEDLIVLDDALGELAREHPKMAEIALLRFLAGFTTEELADIHGVSTRTVERRWRFARAWLQSRMSAA